jgi:TonB family protein
MSEMTANKTYPTVKRPREPEAVRTTIVGGRPPQGDVIPRRIPRGLEVLIKKAAVDPAFRKLLLEKRAGAAEAIGLKLTAAEEAMLAAVPLPQLEGIITHTRISPKLRPAFLGYAAGTMLAALGGSLIVCESDEREYQTGKRETETLADGQPTIEKTTRGGATENKTPGKKNEMTARPLFSETRSQANVVDLDSIASATAGLRGDRPKENDIWVRAVRGPGLGIRPDKPPPSIPGGGFAKARPPNRIWISVSGPDSIEGTGTTHANRSAAVISSVIRHRLTGIQYAYNAALKTNLNLKSGKVVVRFTISASGAVESVRIINDTIGEPTLSKSIIAKIRIWRFPPADGGDVTVIYPFVFIAGEV